MGTGVGEAMLIGAVTGAGTSAITGGDPLKGALFGLAGGAIMPGLSSALGGAEAGAASAATTTPALSSTGAAAIPTGSFGNVGMNMSGFGNTIGSIGAPTTAGATGTFGQVGASGFGNAALPGATDIAGAGASFTPPTAMLPPAGPNLPNLPSSGDLLSRDQKTTSQFGSKIAELINKYPVGAPAAGGALASMMLNQPDIDMPDTSYDGPLKRFRFDPTKYRASYMADGGIAALPASQKYARGGDLGGYSDGGRMLKGPGDGMSDSIPARIGARQPARLADGEFVVPADVVSHLGNGSTDAGAKQLYGMMDKVRKARTGTKKQGREINPRKLMPA